MNKILAIIPARGGSKRLPRKNLLELNAKPLIAWSIEAAQKSKYISKTVVTSDDEEILNIAKTYKVDAIKRPKELASDTATTFDAIKHAQSKQIDVVLIDTAGRSELNTNLMEQLKKIVRVTNPDLKIYVGEALAGNAAVEEAKKFNELVGIDGVIMTKTDADVKGGSILSISYETKKPILFMGTGQDLNDLKKFNKQWFMKKLFEGA